MLAIPELAEPLSKEKFLKDALFIKAGRSSDEEAVHMTPNGTKVIHN